VYHHAYSYCKWRLANCFYFYKTFGISAQLLKRTRITRIRRVNTIRKTVVKTRFERGFRFKVYTAIFHYTRCFIVSIRTKNKNTRTNHRFRRYMPLLARSIFPIQPYSVFSITNTMAGVRSDNNRVKHNGSHPPPRRRRRLFVACEEGAVKGTKKQTRRSLGFGTFEG